MTLVLVLAGLLAPAAILASLVHAIATDGLGTGPTPRSHREELGSWIDRQLTR